MGRQSGEIHRWLARLKPTVERVCTELGVPWQVCLAQARVESGKGTNDLAKRNNYWGLKKYGGKRWEMMGRPDVYKKRSLERVKVRSERHLAKLLKKGAEFIKPPLDEVRAALARGEQPSCRITLPSEFCAWPTLEAGVRGWCAFMKSSRYRDGGVFVDDPERWIAYRWGRGYATAKGYVRAVVKRLNRLARKTGDASFKTTYDEDLKAFVRAALKLQRQDRWDFTLAAYQDTLLGKYPGGVPDGVIGGVEFMSFDDEEIVV